MTTKLTLSIDDDTIRKAKEYAKQTGQSLSSIVGEYLVQLTSSAASQDKLPEDLENLFGIISLPPAYNEKKEIRQILINKK